MGIAEGALMQVRASLCAEIDAIAAALPYRDTAALCASLDSVRRTAQAYDLATVALLARSLEALLAENEGGAPLRSHLELMREAVGCEPLGPDAIEAFLAAAAVRLGDGRLLRRH